MSYPTDGFTVSQVTVNLSGNFEPQFEISPNGVSGDPAIVLGALTAAANAMKAYLEAEIDDAGVQISTVYRGHKITPPPPE